MARYHHAACLLLFVIVAMRGLNEAVKAAGGKRSSSVVLAPDMSTCLTPVDVPAEELRLGLHCCPPAANYTPTLFKPRRPPPGHLRVRRRAHAADQASAQRLARAYALMKALPPTDPRSFIQQANIHCAYCNSIYTQRNSTQRFQVHGCWLFYPFHRWYLYFHERILATLLRHDDPHREAALPLFALPFWNYDHPDGRTMPWPYTQLPELSHALRNPLHLPPAVISLDTNPSSDGVPSGVQLLENAHVMYRSMIRDATSQNKFFGKPYRHGDSPFPGFGSLEEEPHSTVHQWMGDYTQLGWKDMGALYASGRDPVFYAHHAQMDRMWEVWRSLNPTNRNPRDRTFRNAEFVFYDENAQLVRVRAGDALHIKALGYVYEQVELPWTTSFPILQSRGVAHLTHNDRLCVMGSPITEPCSAVVLRDPDFDSSDLAEYLIINGTTWPEGFQSFFTIYVNLPSANNGTTTGCLEYVGCVRGEDQVKFFSFPANSKPSSSFDITARIHDLRLTHQAHVVITLVPKFGSSAAGPSAPASISSISIQYLPPY